MRFLRKLFGSSIVLLITASLISPSSSLAQDFWWTSDYPTFVNVVRGAPEKILSTSYKTGPDGRAEVSLCVKKDEKMGLILEAKLPKQSLFSIDPKTGKKEQAKDRPTLTIRDHDLDGMPDSFNMVPSGQPLYEESLTQDGYIKYRHSQDHRVILIQWVVGIGYSINHFMYGIDSAMPR